MKKSILLLAVLLFTTTISFCQDMKIMTEESNSQTQENSASESYKTYYFDEGSIDSSLFKADSISLYKNKIKPEYPRIELYRDSEFCLFYDIKPSTGSTKDAQSGEMTTLAIENAKEIRGERAILSVADSENEIRDVKLKFILKDGKVFSYAILDKEDRIVLIKD